MIGFTIGLRGLLASSRSMDVLGQNLANFATEGYSRKSADLVSSLPLASPGVGVFGTGVELSDIRRVHDGLLETRLQTQTQLFGHAQARRSMLEFMDGVFSDLGDDGVSARIDGFFDSTSALMGFPSDPALRSALVQSADHLALSFRDVAARLEGLRSDSTETVRAATDTINGLLGQLATINAQILGGSHGLDEASDLLDAQDRVVRDLSEWIDIEAVRRDRGAIDVLADGHLLVSGKRHQPLEFSLDDNGLPRLLVEGSDTELEVNAGRIRGYLDVAADSVPARLAEVHDVARALILETNRLHSTGIPDAGPYSALSAEVAVRSLESRGDPLVSPLDALGFDFRPQAGQLVVNLVHEETGSVQQTVLDIDPSHLSLDEFRTALDGIDQLSASIDGTGRLRLQAASGYGFDFSARVDADPDEDGTFGAGEATLSSAVGPYSLTAGDTMTIDVDGSGPQTVTFQAADFADISQATPEEVAAAIDAQLTGAGATVVDGRVVIQSQTAGVSSSLLVTDTVGTPAASLGLSTALEVGADSVATVTLRGHSTDGSEGRFTVRPVGDGTVGLTDGLQLEVLDENGSVLTTLDVGSGYAPGEEVEVLPGVFLAVQAGEISRTSGDYFEFETFEDSDSSDILVALGLGTLYRGSDASSMELVDRVRDDPRMFAASSSGVVGDGSNLSRLLDLRDRPLATLGMLDLGGAWSKTVTTVGLEVEAVRSQEEAEGLVLQSLEARRDEVSGVNVDEEMLRMVEMQQLYAASARYLQAVNEMTQILYSIV